MDDGVHVVAQFSSTVRQPVITAQGIGYCTSVGTDHTTPLPGTWVSGPDARKTSKTSVSETVLPGVLLLHSPKQNKQNSRFSIFADYHIFEILYVSSLIKYVPFEMEGIVTICVRVMFL